MKLIKKDLHSEGSNLGGIRGLKILGEKQEALIQKREKRENQALNHPQLDIEAQKK